MEDVVDAASLAAEETPSQLDATLPHDAADVEMADAYPAPAETMYEQVNPAKVPRMRQIVELTVERFMKKKRGKN